MVLRTGPQSFHTYTLGRSTIIFSLGCFCLFQKKDFMLSARLTVLKGVREKHSFAPSELIAFPLPPTGLRPLGKLRTGCGLHSCAALRLFNRCFVPGQETVPVLSHTLEGVSL
jgi:hypothetical protein